MMVGLFETVGGLLLLFNRYVPLALALLAPVIVNILCYHLLMNHEGISGAFTAAALWLFLFYAYREYFSSLFVQRAQPR